MPLQNVFAPKIGVEPSTVVDSDVYTPTTSGSIQTITANSTIVKNNVDLGQGTISFSSGDNIKIRVTSEATFGKAKHAVVEINGVKNIFSCVTKPTAEIVNRVEIADKDPFELTKRSDDSDYNPTDSGNKIVVYDDVVPGNLLNTITANVNVNPGLTSTNPIVVVCSYFTDVIHKYDTVTKQLLSVTPIIGGPYGATSVPKDPVNNSINNTWITLSKLNKIAVLSENNVVLTEIIVGVRPMGISTSPDGKHVYVANNGSNTVTHFTWNENSSSWIPSTVNVGTKPFEIACDKNGDAWVTCTNTDKVYKITTQNVVTNYTVGNNPRGIAYSNNLIWVAVSYDNKVIALNLFGTQVHNITNVGVHPYSVATLPEEFVVPGSLNTRYLVLEADDFLSGNFAAINNLEFLDSNGNPIPYTVYLDGSFSLTTNDVPEFWDGQK